MQLINTKIFDKETQARTKAMEETRRQRALRRDEREKGRLESLLQKQNAPPQSSTSVAFVHEVNIDGLRFQVLNRGSRLRRIRGKALDPQKCGRAQRDSTAADALDTGSSTPKQAVVGGVTFLRSKNGNLYRSGIVRAKK